MEIVKRLYLEKTEKEAFQKKPCVIAMGTFDGLHKGHRDVIDAAASYARKKQLRLAVFTFSNHRHWREHKFFQIRDLQFELRRYFRL